MGDFLHEGRKIRKKKSGGRGGGGGETPKKEEEVGEFEQQQQQEEEEKRRSLSSSSPLSLSLSLLCVHLRAWESAINHSVSVADSSREGRERREGGGEKGRRERLASKTPLHRQPEQRKGEKNGSEWRKFTPNNTEIYYPMRPMDSNSS